MKKLYLSLLLGILVFLITGVVVLAVPGKVTNFRANPSTTSVTLTWTKAPLSTSTMIRYLTSGYPTDATGVADGSTQVYFSTSNSVKQLSLTAGTTYYYTAWGYDGSAFSGAGDVANLVVTTLGSASPSDDLPTPALPANYNAAPAGSGLVNLAPLNTIISYFATDWGMPVNNMWLAWYALFMVIVGAILYMRFKEFFLAYTGVILLDVLGIGGGIIPGWSLFVLLMVGAGVWVIEKSFQ